MRVTYVSLSNNLKQMIDYDLKIRSHQDNSSVKCLHLILNVYNLKFVLYSPLLNLSLLNSEASYYKLYNLK